MNISNLQTSLAQAAQALPHVDNIGVSNDTRDLFYLIDFLVHLVESAYPFIPCTSGCSNCCVESGLPRTSSLEWAHIYRYLSEEMPVETRLRVIEQNENFHQPQLGLFLQEQERLAQIESEQQLPAFGCKQCPFLVDNLCTVYPVRPAICRGFGYFSWRPGMDRDSQIFACQMAADTLLDNLQRLNQPHAALPNWNGITQKVYDLEQALGTGTVATLPLWLMAHTQGQQLTPLNLSPDFQTLASLPASDPEGASEPPVSGP